MTEITIKEFRFRQIQWLKMFGVTPAQIETINNASDNAQGDHYTLFNEELKRRSEES
jgi:hypothetical protein